MNNLFEKFPIINYANTVGLNIVSKINLANSTFKNTQIFYPYEVNASERPEHIAFNYYDDPRYLWMVFLSNKTIDPYYDWPLDDNTFEGFIKEKYGSTENAIETILFYRHNFKNDDRVLGIEAYKALPSRLKSYWRSNNDELGQTVFYTRRESDIRVDTNRIVYVNVANSSIFTKDQKVTSRSLMQEVKITTLSPDLFRIGDTITQGTANGEIVWMISSIGSGTITLVIDTNTGSFVANNTPAVTDTTANGIISVVNNTSLVTTGVVDQVVNNTVIIKHIEGRFSSSGSNLTISGTTSNSDITEVINIIQDSNGKAINISIPDDEYYYWEPVSAYTYETEVSDGKKFIKLLDSAYLDKAEKEISDLL